MIAHAHWDWDPPHGGPTTTRNLIVLGSRIYEPLSDVDDAIRALPSDATVTAFGSADICKRAVLAAESRGLSARNVVLSPSRRELVEAARQPGAKVVLFVAMDPSTRRPTVGITQVADYLASQGIATSRVASPLPGRVCELMTRQRQAIDRAIELAGLPARRRHFVMKGLALTTELVNERDRYERKLEAGFRLQADDDAATAKWCRWLVTYQQLCTAIEDARLVLLTSGGIAA